MADPSEFKVNRPKYLGRSKTPLCDVAKQMVKNLGYDEWVALELVLKFRGLIKRGAQRDSTAGYVAREIVDELKEGGN